MSAHYRLWQSVRGRMAAADWPTDRKMLYLHSGEKHDYALWLAKLFSGFAETFATLAQEMDDRELRRPATGGVGNGDVEKWEFFVSFIAAVPAEL